MKEFLSRKYKQLSFFIASIMLLPFVMIELEAKTERKLLVPSDNKIYFSAFPDFGGSEDIVTPERIENFEALSKKELAWASFSQHWFNGLDYPAEQIQTIFDKGIMPYVRFLPRSDLSQFKVEENFTLSKIINGAFDDELRKWAQDAKNHDIPLIMDFGLEMNGDWFAWGGQLNGGEKSDAPRLYRNAYRHIIDLFKEEGVHHITWFFHPTIMSTPNEAWNSPKYYYPGDDYIDWIGISLYGPFHPGENYWETFDEILEHNYQKILEISPSKPLAILELGVTDHHPLGKKEVWLKEAFETILSEKYVSFKAITYWHENWDNDGILTSLKIDSSEKSLGAFRKAVESERFTSQINLSGD